MTDTSAPPWQDTDTGLNPFAGRDLNWLLDARAATRAEHPFLIWEPFAGQRRVWTYRAFRDQTLAVAAGLAARGVKPGCRVMVHLDNGPELELLWFACQRIGAIVVTTNTRSAGPEIAYYAEASGAVGAIVQPELAALVADHAKSLRWLIVTEHLADGGPASAALLPEPARRFSSLAGDPASLAPLAPDPARAGSVQFTSGTTSRPKAVLWTHANALWGARQSAAHQALTAADVHHVMMPAFHTNARTYSILPTLWAGGSYVLQPKFSGSRFWDVALANRCTWASMIPFALKALAEKPIPKHHFRMFGGPANGLPLDKLFGVRTLGWWGMTETITQGIVGEVHVADRAMTTGRPAPGYGLRVVDDAGTPIAPGATGHLQIRGRRGIQLFAEYFGNAQATADSFTADGWFITGDRVRLDADGLITFADRDKDMLKVGAENVAASEIERVIAPIAGVGEVAVVGQRHAMLDEVPVAFVIAAAEFDAAGHADLAARIIAACRAQLADFKVVRAVHIVAEFPRATLEKVNKAELRKRLPPLG